MKKVMALSVVFIGISVAANAQEIKTTPVYDNVNYQRSILQQTAPMPFATFALLNKSNDAPGNSSYIFTGKKDGVTISVEAHIFPGQDYLTNVFARPAARLLDQGVPAAGEVKSRF